MNIEYSMRRSVKSLRRDNHSVSMLTNHMVFSPKYRGRMLKGDVKRDCEKVLCQICKENKVQIIDLAVACDHVHLFIKYPPKHSISRLANRIKGQSSKRLRAMHPELVRWCRKGLWARSCFHASVGHGMDVVEQYISGQK